jgi:hypothetical protein
VPTFSACSQTLEAIDGLAHAVAVEVSIAQRPGQSGPNTPGRPTWMGRPIWWWRVRILSWANRPEIEYAHGLDETRAFRLFVKHLDDAGLVSFLDELPETRLAESA